MLVFRKLGDFTDQDDMVALAHLGVIFAYEMRGRAREWARPDAAHAIAQVARALLDKAAYIDLLAAPPARSGEAAYLM